MKKERPDIDRIPFYHWDTTEQLSQYNQLIAQYAAVIQDASLSAFLPEARYSGKITTRIAPHIHEQAAKLAEEQGISLNQYINDAIVALNNQLLGVKRAAPALTTTVEKLCQKLQEQPSRSATQSGTISGTFCYTLPKKGE